MISHKINYDSFWFKEYAGAFYLTFPFIIFSQYHKLIQCIYCKSYTIDWFNKRNSFILEIICTFFQTGFSLCMYRPMLSLWCLLSYWRGTCKNKTSASRVESKSILCNDVVRSGCRIRRIHQHRWEWKQKLRSFWIHCFYVILVINISLDIFKIVKNGRNNE